MEYLTKYSSSKILEIGCGLEPIGLYYTNYKEYTISEPAAEFYDNAKRILPTAVQIVPGFFEDNLHLFRKNEYDFIVLSSLLHEIEAADVFLSAVLDVANSDTIIHINVPNANSFHRILAMCSGLIAATKAFSDRNIMYQQHRVFDINTLKSFIEKIANSKSRNVDWLDEGSYFIKPFTHAQMQKMIETGIINKRILNGLYNMEQHIPGMGSEIFVNFKVR